MSVYRVPKGGKNKWKVDIHIGYKEDGKAHRIIRTFTGSKKEAIAFEAQLKAELKDGTFVPNNGYNFAEFSQIWLDKYAKPNLAPKTYSEYVRLIGVINKQLGHYKLQNIKPLTLVNFYSNLRKQDGT